MELISQVAELLPTSSAAAFSLTCGPVQTMLGSKYVSQLRSKDDNLQRDIFLALLANDMPDHISCHYCKLLHPVTAAIPSQYYQYVRRYKCADVNPYPICAASNYHNHAQYIHMEFSPALFQMVMKRARNGLDYSDQISRMNTTRIIKDEGCVILTKSSARITKETKSLMYRVQTCARIPSGKREDWPQHGFVGVTLCQHKWRFGRTDERWREETYNEFYRRWNDGNFQSASGSCRNCPTDWQLDLRDFGAEGRVLYITKWIHLGKDVTDPNWSNLVGNTHRDYNCGTGFLRKKLEQSETFDFELVLEAEEIEELFKKKHKHEWRLTYQQPGGYSRTAGHNSTHDTSDDCYALSAQLCALNMLNGC